MKTIYCKKEITLNVNKIDYTFEKQQFIQRCEIEQMQKNLHLWYRKGGRTFRIEPIPEKLVNWFEDVAKSNNISTLNYDIIDIK